MEIGCNYNSCKQINAKEKNTKKYKNSYQQKSFKSHLECRKNTQNPLVHIRDIYNSLFLAGEPILELPLVVL